MTKKRKQSSEKNRNVVIIYKTDRKIMDFIGEKLKLEVNDKQRVWERNISDFY